MSGLSSMMMRNHKSLFKTISWWPPYATAGIKVTRVNDNLRELDVQMKMHFWNKNVFGTHFGGSIYSMVDPWYCIMLMQNLGKEYMVWDKAATIQFKSPGKGTIHASFNLTEEKIRETRAEADRLGKSEPHFLVKVLDSSGKLVAEVDKIISVRRKDKIKNRPDNI